MILYQLIFFLDIGADVLDLTGQSTNSFGRLEEEDVHFELSDNQKHYLQMLQTMNSYFKDEYHALHQFLWLNGHKSIPTSLPDRLVHYKTATW